MVTSRCTFAGLSGLWDAVRHHLGWVSSLVSCRDAVRCVRNFLSGWCNYGALDLDFSNKQILSAIERRVKCQSFQTSVEAGDCPVSLRTGCHLLLLPCHTDTAPWLGWLVAGNNWCRILIFSPGSSFHSKEAPLLAFRPQPAAQPPRPPLPPLQPGADESWAWCSEAAEIHQAPFTPAHSRESPAPDFSGFFTAQTTACGPEGRLKRTCVVVLSPFITLLASSAACLELRGGFLSA